MTRPWRTLEAVPTDEGTLELRRRGDDEFLIVVGGRVLMTSVHRSTEEALATLGCAHLARRPAPRVLVGGLGMAFTLRAALDVLPAGARVVVAELHPVVAAWCRGPLAPLTRSAVADPRVKIEIADVARVVERSAPGRYDAILLDLYEGPNAATQRPDDPLYGAAALARARAALTDDGVLAIWAEDPDAAFARRFADAGFTVSVERPGRGGRAHVVYLGTKGDAPKGKGTGRAADRSPPARRRRR